MNMIFSWNKQNSNYHLIKHLLFKSFIRPWTCIFICLGRSSEEKVTQGHLDPWILEPMFLLWHCLSTWVQRLVYQGLQVNVSVSSFWGCNPILNVCSYWLRLHICLISPFPAMVGPNLWTQSLAGVLLLQGWIYGNKPFTGYCPDQYCWSYPPQKFLGWVHLDWSNFNTFSIINADEICVGWSPTVDQH